MAAGLILGATLTLAVAAILTGDTLLIVWGSGIELAGRLTPLSAIMLILPPLVALPVVVRGALTEEGPGLPRMVGLLLVFVEERPEPAHHMVERVLMDRLMQERSRVSRKDKGSAHFGRLSASWSALQWALA